MQVLLASKGRSKGRSRKWREWSEDLMVLIVKTHGLRNMKRLQCHDNGKLKILTGL